MPLAGGVENENRWKREGRIGNEREMKLKKTLQNSTLFSFKKEGILLFFKLYLKKVRPPVLVFLSFFEILLKHKDYVKILPKLWLIR